MEETAWSLVLSKTPSSADVTADFLIHKRDTSHTYRLPGTAGFKTAERRAPSDTKNYNTDEAPSSPPIQN